MIQGGYFFQSCFLGKEHILWLSEVSRRKGISGISPLRQKVYFLTFFIIKITPDIWIRISRKSGESSGSQRLPQSTYNIPHSIMLHGGCVPLENRSVPLVKNYNVYSWKLWFCKVFSGDHRIQWPAFQIEERNNFIFGTWKSKDYAMSKVCLPLEDKVLASCCETAGFLRSSS